MVETGAIFKGFTFNGIDSKDYGIYITGEAVYNAPEKDVEFITIPGRNGDFALDHGRYSNIEVTYPAGFFGEDEADFTQGIADIRNILCSQKGYLRLEDEYNPGEYRMAVYKSGLEVSPAALKGGEFDITFVCKPQRFLTTGETPVSLSSGDTITNPTLYEAKPLLHVTGYGDFGINGVKDMSVQSPGRLGLITVATLEPSPNPTTATYSSVNTSLIDNGDRLHVRGASMSSPIIGSVEYVPDTSGGDTIESVVFESVSYTIQQGDIYRTSDGLSFGWASGTVFTEGTSVTRAATITNKVSYTLNGTATTENFTNRMEVHFNGTDEIYINLIAATPSHFTIFSQSITAPNEVMGSSSKPAPNDVYIDLDIGEAYRVSGGVVQSVNDQVHIPAQLPSLVPGANTVKFDNTITAFEVTPRWWQL